ncbi:11809_t:CDS:2 [Dentiscutata erythropus]|uniref:11809_t:CDS:1 n=1 Tax=Dentiscutata erythropus TaxID=1348616 RepID=A0A9N9BZ11_9GLOM|nr:11809_t:CDS:2 [Dentiscutata erythropus]
MSAQNKNVICVTSCDSYLGYAITQVLLQDKKQNQRAYTVRALARDISGLNGLKKHGAEVAQIDYNNQGTIEQALNGGIWVLMLPESDNDRCNYAKIFANTCKKVGVGNMLFLSLLGADDADEKSLREFRDMEKKVEAAVDRNCILRCAFVVQCLHYFSEYIMKKNKLGLPIRSDSRMSPIHLNDVFCVIHRIIFDKQGQLHREMDRNHQKRHYTLTGPEAISANTFVDMMNIIIDANVKFEEIKRQECEAYLRSCNQPEIESTKSDQHEESRDDLFPTPKQCLNDNEIMTACDIFDYIKSGKANYVSGDVQKVTDREPIPVIWFFKNHREEFKPRK